MEVMSLLLRHQIHRPSDMPPNQEVHTSTSGEMLAYQVVAWTIVQTAGVIQLCLLDRSEVVSINEVYFQAIKLREWCVNDDSDSSDTLRDT